MPKSADRADPPNDLDPSSLGEVAAETDQTFPLVIRRTGLVLFDVDPEHLQAQWQVESDHLEKARSAFPAEASDVQPVLRLLRADAPAGEREVAVRELAKVEGTVRFSVSDHGAMFLAELGLVSRDGGWLLLARSNQVQLPQPIRRPIPVRTEPLTQSPQPLQPAFVAHRHDQPGARPSLPDTLQGVGRGQRQAEDRTSAPFDATLAHSGARIAPIFPQPLQTSAWSPEAPFERVINALHGVDADGESVPLPVSSSVHARPSRADGGWEPRSSSVPLGAAHSSGELPPPLLPPRSSTRSIHRDLPEFPAYDPFAGVSSRSPIGSSPQRPGIEVQAEVLVSGRAEPGSLIDLFGQRLRVGADGRFMLRRALDDPMLLGLVVGGWLRSSSADPDTE